MIIANAAIDDFRPEDVLAAYDARNATCHDKVVNFVAKYFIDRINGLLLRRFWRDEPNFAAQCREEALSRFLEAILDPTISRGDGLRVHFNQTVTYAMLAAKTTLSGGHRRSTRPEKLEKERQGRTDSPEAEIIREMDRDKARARLHARAPYVGATSYWPSSIFWHLECYTMK